MSSFEWSGAVMGCPRPRHARSGQTYMPRAYLDYKEALGWAYRAAGGGFLGDGPVSVHIDIMRALPKSRPKRVESEPDLGKPDLDNVAKAVLDALNGVAYADDAQVVSLVVNKLPRERRETDALRVRVARWMEEE